MPQFARFAFVFVAAALVGPALAWASVDDPVESGREALGDWSEFPWYDAKADDVRPVRGRKTAQEVKGEPGDRQKKRDGERESRDDSSTLFPAPSGLLAGGTVVAWVIVGAIVVALVGMVIYAILQSDGLKGRDRQPSATEGVDLDALPVPVVAADTDLLAEARRLYERGEFGQAMVYLYSHVLVRLDRGHLIRLAKGKTNRQYLREVGSRRPLAEFFESVMHTFEAAFFGRRALPRDEFEVAWRGIDDFHRMIDEARA